MPALALGLSACETTPPLYDWGSYEASVGRVATQSDGFDLQAEIDRLRAEMTQTFQKNRQVPPGFRIHLAYLHLLQGDGAAASVLFEQEKTQYPESSHFIDGVLRRLKRSPSRAAQQ